MGSKHYDRHWDVFGVAARPILEAARGRLQGPGQYVGAIEETSADDEKALGFALKDLDSGGCLYVDLWLLDGADRGFGVDDAGAPKVGVSLSIVDQDGLERFVHTPNNYGAAVGVSGSLDLLERVNGYFEAGAIAEMVRSVASSCFKGLATGMVPPRNVVAGHHSPAPGF